MNRNCIMDVFHMPKLQADLFLLSNFFWNWLKMQCHINRCIVARKNGDMVAIAQYKGNFYQIIFIEVCGLDASNFVHSRARRSSGALAPPIRTLQCEEHLCTPKHGEGLNLGRISWPLYWFAKYVRRVIKRATKLNNDAEKE